ncbi:MAG TPA: hypothetical protein DD640_04000 [Clostridiales bacterium]|nr:hypothetical protein [Clostridiales bacterium]
MGIYQELGLKTIINASDTYTRIGGSRMSDGVLAAMCEAGQSFVDLVELAQKACQAIARMTQNESAFISSGAGACLVLTAAALITRGDPYLERELPDASRCAKNEIIIFAAQTAESMPGYWQLLGKSGASLVKIKSSLKSLRDAITGKTAGIYYFLGDRYETGLPPLPDIIRAAHEREVPLIIDAAAQLPPKSNLWHYTRDLGADGIIFSGGKYLMGPQSTGLFLGKEEIARRCYALSNPNIIIGRPYKVGKEEYAAIYTAVKEFVAADEDQVRSCQNKHLDVIEQGIGQCPGIVISRVQHGRVGQDAPMLVIDLTNGKTARDCADFLSRQCDPAIDIGYEKDVQPGQENRVLINSINLRENELYPIIRSLKRFCEL